uniref:sulfate transport system permease protein n=1 Tax=Prototheca vistulensis TaxID=2689584 RepID=UPI0030029FAD
MKQINNLKNKIETPIKKEKSLRECKQNYIYTYKTCRKKEYNRFFSLKALENLLDFFMVERRMFFFIMVHFSFIVLLPLYAIFRYVYNSPWDIVMKKASNPVAIHSILLSFKLAFITAIINSFFGFIIAWCLVRYKFKGRKWFNAAIDLPFSMPTSVTGLTLIKLYGSKGLGRFLGNNQIIYTKKAVLLAMIFTTFPFVVRSIQPVLEKVTEDIELEETAWSFSYDDNKTFKEVLFPLCIPPLLNGFTLTFCRALGEFGSVVLVSGNFPFEDLVSSVFVSQTLEQYDYIGACVISSMVILGACVFLFIMFWFRYYFVIRKQ